MSRLLQIGTILGLLALGALSLAWYKGSHLPTTLETTAQRTLAHPPSEVWAKIRDISEYPHWQGGVRAVMSKDSSDEGVTQWTEVHARSMLACRILHSVVPDSLTLESTSEQKDSRVTVSWMLEPVPNDSTHISVTFTREVAPPLMRLFERWTKKDASGAEALVNDLQSVLK